ncbi:Uncharacterised protein [Klebsiella pneumoniae]|nr:Uncharacterised protein [Klebsiella pneumoniae]
MYCNTMPDCKFNMVTVNHFQRFAFRIHTVTIQNWLAPKNRSFDCVLHWASNDFWLEYPCCISVGFWLFLSIYKKYSDQTITIFHSWDEWCPVLVLQEMNYLKIEGK